MCFISQLYFPNNMLGLDISVSTALAESKIAIITGRQVHTALLCLQYLRNSEPARKH